MTNARALGAGKVAAPAAALIVGLLAAALPGRALAQTADLPAFPIDPAALARARAVKSLPCGGGDADGFALEKGTPPVWRMAGASLSVRRGGGDRFAFVLAPPKGGGGDCAVEDVVPLPRTGQMLQCTMPSGATAGLGVHTLVERLGRRMVLFRYDGADGLSSRGEDQSAVTETGEMICALPEASQWQQSPPAAPAAPSGGLAGTALALLGAVLSYAVLGAPLRSVAGLLGMPPRARGPRDPAAARFPIASFSMAQLAAAVAALAARLALASLAMALLSLPGASAVGGVAAVGCIVAALRRSPRRRLGKADGDGAPPSRVAVAIAALVNDGVAASAGLLCLALLARHDGWLLAAAVALGIAASLPPAILGRRRLRRSPAATGGAAALLAAAIGLSVFADPWVTRAVGAPFWLLLLGPLLCAAAVVGMGLPRRPEAVPR